MKTLILLAMSFCLSSFAQDGKTTLNLKLSEIEISPDGAAIYVRLNEDQTLYAFFEDEHAQERGFEYDYELGNIVANKLAALKTTNPNAIIQVEVDGDNDIIINQDTFKVIDEGVDENEEIAALKAQIEALKAQKTGVSQDLFDYVNNRLLACEADNEGLNQSLGALQTNTASSNSRSISTEISELTDEELHDHVIDILGNNGSSAN